MFVCVLVDRAYQHYCCNCFLFRLHGDSDEDDDDDDARTDDGSGDAFSVISPSLSLAPIPVTSLAS